jgi:hypothetical protein
MQNINEELDSHDEDDGRKIRESFEQFQQAPPLPDLWANIADALQKEDGAPPLNPVANAFHDHYLAESQSQKSKKNVADVWQALQTQLPKPKRKLQKYMAALLLLLLLRQCSQGIGEATIGEATNSMATVISTIKNSIAKIESHKVESYANNPKTIAANIASPQTKKKASVKKLSVLTAENKAIFEENTTPILNNEIKVAEKTAANTKANSTAALPLALAAANPKTPLDSSVTPIMLPIDLEQEYKKKTFAPSVELALKVASNTPIFYGELSRKAFDPSSSNSTDFHTALHLSLQVQYHFSPKQAVIAELAPMATYRQTFGEFESSGQYIKCSLRLVYRQISVGYQYQFRTTFVQAAAQFGYLSQSREIISFSAAPSYKRMKYALSLAIGQKHSFKKLNLSYGVAASLSLNNISKDSAIRIFSFSPFVALGYNF